MIYEFKHLSVLTSHEFSIEVTRNIYNVFCGIVVWGTSLKI